MSNYDDFPMGDSKRETYDEDSDTARALAKAKREKEIEDEAYQRGLEDGSCDNAEEY